MNGIYIIDFEGCEKDFCYANKKYNTSRSLNSISDIILTMKHIEYDGI